MNKKTIIFIWKSPYPREVRIKKICDSLYPHYNIVILSRWSDEELEEEKVGNFTVRRVGFRKSSIASAPISQNRLWKKSIEKAIRDFDAKLLIVKEVHLGYLTGKVAQKFNIPAVLSMAENYPAVVKLFKKYKRNFLTRLLIHDFELIRKMEESTMKVIPNLIVVCPEQIERLKEENTFHNHKYVVMNNTPTFTEGTQIEKNDGSLVFGHHGFLTGDKNIYKFLDALIELINEGEDITFHILGHGEVFEDTKNIIDKSGYQENLIMHGKWDDEMYNKYLNDINYGVLPYDINDFTNTTNFNKFWDFTEVGIPLVTSKTKPMDRVINEFGCGITIDIDDKTKIKSQIKELKNMNYKQMAQNSYNCFKDKYNWTLEEKDLVIFIGELI